MQTFRESTIPAERLRHHSMLPHVPGLAVGDIVYSKYGRRMRVERTNEYVSNGETATGPYCALQALDDKTATPSGRAVGTPSAARRCSWI